jgi:hypothetical protein
MGILLPTERLVRELIGKRLKPGFSVLEFGDQIVTHCTPHYLARELYKSLGCGHYVSVDGNGRNGAIAFDLNRKTNELRALLKLKVYDLVTDFGTGEHIFDQAAFWRTVHLMTAPGGFIAFDRPSQGYPGHCFWRTDLSTFQDIAAANSYEVLALRAHAGRHGGELVHGIFRKTLGGKFQVPNQGRYRKLLRGRI